jgi:hypothetical protein
MPTPMPAASQLSYPVLGNVPAVDWAPGDVVVVLPVVVVGLVVVDVDPADALAGGVDDGEDC